MAVLDLFKCALGWNNAGALALLSPQPRGDPKKNFQGLLVGLPRNGGDGSRVDDGLYCQLPYNYLNDADWLSVLGQLGLSYTVASAKVTISVLDVYTEVYRNFNGWAQRPRMGVEAVHDMAKFRDVVFLVTRLVAI